MRIGHLEFYLLILHFLSEVMSVLCPTCDLAVLLFVVGWNVLPRNEVLCDEPNGTSFVSIFDKFRTFILLEL